jgi:hypothetical protein
LLYKFIHIYITKIMKKIIKFINENKIIIGIATLITFLSADKAIETELKSFNKYLHDNSFIRRIVIILAIFSFTEDIVSSTIVTLLFVLISYIIYDINCDDSNDEAAEENN